MPTYIIETTKDITVKYSYAIEASTIEEALDMWSEDKEYPYNEEIYTEGVEMIIDAYEEDYDDEDYEEEEKFDSEADFFED